MTGFIIRVVLSVLSALAMTAATGWPFLPNLVAILGFTLLFWPLFARKEAPHE